MKQKRPFKKKTLLCFGSLRPAVITASRKKTNYSGMYMSYEYVHYVVHNSAHIEERKNEQFVTKVHSAM